MAPSPYKYLKLLFNHVIQHFDLQRFSEQNLIFNANCKRTTTKEKNAKENIISIFNVNPFMCSFKSWSIILSISIKSLTQYSYTHVPAPNQIKWPVIDKRYIIKHIQN